MEPDPRGAKVLGWLAEREAECLRCDTVLFTEEDLRTGICADCWIPDFDGYDGDL